MNSWPFQEPKNFAVLTIKRIKREGYPILRVIHDKEDGGWQFLDNGFVSEEDALVVSLGSITQLDPTIFELADLPLGWQAERIAPKTLWQRSPIFDYQV